MMKFGFIDGLPSPGRSAHFLLLLGFWGCIMHSVNGQAPTKQVESSCDTNNSSTKYDMVEVRCVYSALNSLLEYLESPSAMANASLLYDQKAMALRDVANSAMKNCSDNRVELRVSARFHSYLHHLHAAARAQGIVHT